MNPPNIDWTYIGSTIAALALGAYSVIRSHSSDAKSKDANKRSEEAEKMANAARVEILAPMNDRPSMYDNVMAIRDGLSDLASLVRANRQEYRESIEEMRKDMRELGESLNHRITQVEAAVQNYVLTEKRLAELEGQVKLIIGAAVPKQLKD